MDQSTPFAVSNDGTLSASIIGDLPMVVSPPNFETRYLAILSSPFTNPVFLGGSANWMVIPPGLVFLDGSKCGLIGVSYEAFYSQENRCGKLPGSCLGNQLNDLYDSDDNLRALNRTPTYLLSRYGAFRTTTELSTHKLQHFPTGISNTLVSVSIKADDVRLVKNRSTGEIVQAWVPNFQTFSRDGKLHVTAANTGALSAQYTLTVTECNTTGILPVPVQVSTIIPFGSWSAIFQLYSQNLFSSSDHCTVTLYDSAYALLDSVVVYFNTTRYVPDRGPQGGTLVQDPQSYSFDSTDSCKCSFFDILCHIVGCANRSKALLVIGIIIAIVVVFVILCKTRCLRKPSKLCCCCGGEGKDNNGAPVAAAPPAAAPAAHAAPAASATIAHSHSVAENPSKSSKRRKTKSKESLIKSPDAPPASSSNAAPIVISSEIDVISSSSSESAQTSNAFASSSAPEATPDGSSPTALTGSEVTQLLPKPNLELQYGMVNYSPKAKLERK